MRNDATTSLIALCILGVLAFLLWLSRSLGASFSSVCTAAMPVLFCAVIALLAWRFLDDFGFPLLAGFLVVSWPAVWPVLDSIASGRRDADTFFHPMSEPLVSSDWLKWGVEALFVGLLALAIYLRRRRRYW
ncbi:hypothetical protein [Paraburkholderia tuberum]|uniref:Transmembrane protein n=1 Tax=Paraburkholderia tuberum TaxID=157910 RepID=A0A1H1KKH4_9BURK|nr:hypothetical protein [Paraburkholderia tuberum]SDR62861.1 hypothetical protein SAMN05445850_8476 [Paraburkholderia tuberum]